MDRAMGTVQVFPAARAAGAGWRAWLLAGLLVLLTVGLLAGVLLGNMPTGPKIGLMALAAFMLWLTVTVGVVTALAVNNVRYELLPGGLQIWIGPVRGPFLRRAEIHSVTRPRDVRPHLWTSLVGWRLDGLYVATVNNPHHGKVSLFVTTRDRHLVLLDTESGRYGLSPEDPDAFIQALGSWGVPEVRDPGMARRQVERPATGAGVLQPRERRLFVIAATLLIIAGIWVVLRLPALPEQVPVHFGLDGQPDRYGSPVELVGLALFLTASELLVGVGLLWLFARSADPFTGRMLALMSLASSVAIAVMAVSMTY